MSILEGADIAGLGATAGALVCGVEVEFWEAADCCVFAPESPGSLGFRSYTALCSSSISTRVIKIRVVFTLAPRAVASASSKRKSGLVRAKIPG